LALDWSRLLSDPKVIALLKGLLAKNVESVTPTVTNDGKIVYGEIGQLASDETGEVLDRLAGAGVFEKRSESRLLACPVHEGALDLMPRLRCPSCNSMIMRKGTLTQHICGNIAPRESFGNTCPKCGKPSPEQSLKLVGSWYECENCKTRSATPNVYLYCRKFDHDFPVAQAKLVDKPSYKLTSEAATDLRQRLGTIIGIAEGLQARGVQVKISGMITGASGVEHTFDLVLEQGKKTVPVDVKVSQDGEVQVVGVLATYAKVLDIGAKVHVMVAIPAASADSKRTAAAYGMLVVEGKNSDSIVEALVGSLQREEGRNGPQNAAYLEARKA